MSRSPHPGPLASATVSGREELTNAGVATGTDGVAFFSAANLLMFLLPVWWLQPVLDNLTCLVFNTYLSYVSHATPRDPEEEARLAELAKKGQERDIKGMEEIHWKVVQAKRSKR